MGSELRLRITEDGADVDRLTSLTGYLRDELVRLDVPRVVREPGGANAVKKIREDLLQGYLVHTALHARDV